jgi:hypothetical protein
LTRIRQPNTAKAIANNFDEQQLSQSRHTFTWPGCRHYVRTQAPRADFAHLTLQSQSGDFIGQGGTFDIVYPSNEILGPGSPNAARWARGIIVRA